MNNKTKKQRVVFCSFANLKSGSFGDAINDRKLFEAIPPKYEKIALFPLYNNKERLKIGSVIKFIALFLREIISSNRIFIIRGPKLAILPIILNKVFKNKIILRSGCTPLMFVERMAFSENIDYYSKESPLKRIFYYIEPNLEKFGLRNSDGFIVENTRAKKLIIYYGAAIDKIKIIPYYIQDYFIKGQNPDFDKNKDYFKIGYVGRFKKYDLLIPTIDAIDFLKKQKYLIKLFLIGDGPNRKFVEKYANKKELKHEIIFLGEKSHKDVALIINEYHCMLLPMLNKLCPSTIAIKILESVMKGKIIISTKSGYNPSLFLNYTDLLLDNAKPENIVQTIKLVIEKYDKFKKVAESLSKYHKILRSKSENSKRIDILLSELMY